MISFAGSIAHRTRLLVLVNQVALEYDVSPEDLISGGRTKCLAEARHVLFFLARELTSLSYPELGRAFGRDHTTVLSAVHRVQANLVGDAHLFALVDRVRQSVLTEWAGDAA